MAKQNAAYMLRVLQDMAAESGAEINITQDGISLWTTDPSDFTCQSASPEDAVKAMKALKRFYKYWRVDK